MFLLYGRNYIHLTKGQVKNSLRTNVLTVDKYQAAAGCCVPTVMPSTSKCGLTSAVTVATTQRPSRIYEFIYGSTPKRSRSHATAAIIGRQITIPFDVTEWNIRERSSTSVHIVLTLRFSRQRTKYKAKYFDLIFRSVITLHFNILGASEKQTSRIKRRINFFLSKLQFSHN